MVKKSKYLDAFFKLIIISGIIHLISLAIYALINRNVSVFNYFNIISISSLYAPLGKGAPMFILSAIIAVILYAIALRSCSARN